MSRLVVLVGLVMALAVALPGSTEATSLNEVKKLTVSDAQAGEYFGRAVAISIDTVIVGAQSREIHQSGPPFAFAGGGESAYIFGRNQGGAGNWGEVKKLTASDAQPEDQFGYSVTVNGDTALVGAYGADVAARIDAGAVYVFHRDEGGADNWGQVKKITASDLQDLSYFGYSVALKGDTAVVGAPTAPFLDTGGAAYVFQRDRGGVDNWGQVKKLTAAEANDQFGWSVAVSGDIAVVGANHGDMDTSVANSGTAYVFQRDAGSLDNWSEVKKLFASDAEKLDEFGWSVAISGDTAVVGALSVNGIEFHEGAAYVFQSDEGGADNWGEVKKLVASDAERSARYGVSVAVDGDTVLIGAADEDTEALNAGVAYEYQRDEGSQDNWGEVKKLIASDAQFDDFFGQSVGVSGSTTVVGAVQEGAGGSNAGAAYVFDLLFPKPTRTPTPTSTVTPTPTALPTFNPVGGIALDADLRSLPLEAASAGSSPWFAIIATIAAIASAAVVGGAAWYARRRRRFA